MDVKCYAKKMAAANAAGNAWKRQEAAEGAANVAQDRGDWAEYVRLAAISDALRVVALAASAAAHAADLRWLQATQERISAEAGYRGPGRPATLSLRAAEEAAWNAANSGQQDRLDSGRIT